MGLVRVLCWFILAIILLNVLNEMVPRVPPPSQQQQRPQQQQMAFYDKWEQRPYIQTHASQSEWFIVDAVQIYGKFMESRPFYDFEYMQVVSSYWMRLARATDLSIQHSGLFNTTATMYFAMQLFMGTLLTANFAVMGAFSFPIRFIIGGAEPDQILLTLTIDQSSAFALHQDLALPWPSPSALHSWLDVDGRLDGGWTSFHVWWPRYRLLLNQLEKLATRYPHLTVAAIDGHKQVAVKFATCLDTLMANFNTNGFVINDWYQLAGQPFLIAEVPTQQLARLIRTPHDSPIHPIHIFDF